MGNHILKKLINNVGFYSEIDISVSKSAEKVLVINYDEESEWWPSIYFGCTFFYEKYSKTSNSGLVITVNDLQSQIIDTSFMVVFYNILKALSDELSFEIPELDIDSLGNFVIPK